MSKMKFKIKGKTTADTIENVSLLIFGISALFVFIGVSVGSFISGFPVLLGIIGSILILIGIAVLIVSEFWRILRK